MSHELDRKIAELMGYKVVSMADDDDYWMQTSEANIPERTLAAYVHVPMYSFDWNAMRTLVEWLQGKGISVQIIATQVNGANYYRVVLYFEEVGKTVEGARMDDDSAPLALCQAVLSLPLKVLE